MQLAIGVAALSIAMVTPLWAARVVLSGIVAMLTGLRQQVSGPNPPT